MGLLASGIWLACAGALTIDNGNVSVRYDEARGTFALYRGPQCFASGERFNAASGVSARVIEVNDALGTGKAIEERADSGLTVVLAVYDGLPFVCIRCAQTNPLDQPLAINELEPVALDLNWGAPPDALNVLGCDGLTPASIDRTSYTFLAVAEPKSGAGAVCGWLTQYRGSGVVLSEPREQAVRVIGNMEYGGKLTMAPGATVEGETFAVGFFADAHEGLEAYAAAIAKAQKITLPKVPAGYCTWYHAGALNASGVAKLSEYCAKNLADFGFEVIQIDDGWQTSGRDFTQHRSDGPYPAGMAATAKAIAGNGLRPGLWFIPFGWDHTAPVFADRQDWFVHRPDGSIYAVEWGGDCLDMTHPDARKFVQEVTARIVRDWGYSYLKIDGLWTGMATELLYPEPSYRADGFGDAVFHDTAMTNVEAYRAGLRAVREAAGASTFVLGCNIAQNMRTLGASMGLVDGMRVGRDIGTQWPAILPSAEMGSRLYFLHGKVWYNDPDCLLVRDPLTLEQARAWGSWIGISGQMNLVSEWLPSLPPEKLDIVKRTMPNHGRNARPVDLFASPLPRIWNLEVEQAGTRWNAVAVFNWDAERADEVTVDLARLGLAASEQDVYVGFDFWADAFVPAFAQRITLPLPPSSCRVLAVHRQLERPQLVSTSRHVTQGAVDLVSVQWDAAQRTLSGVSRVVAGDPYELRVATPPTGGWHAVSATLGDDHAAAGATISLHDAEWGARVRILSPQTGEVSWKVNY